MSLVLTMGGTTAATLTISSGKVANYTVTVTETSGALAHLFPCWSSYPIFQYISPSSLSPPRGTSGTSLITLTSLNGFAGTVTLSTVVSSASSPRMSLSSSSVTLTLGGRSISRLQREGTAQDFDR